MSGVDLSNLSELVIFGASKGIGAAIARELALKKLPKIHLVARNKEAMATLATELGSSDVEIVCHEVDLASEKEVERLFHHFEDQGAFPRHWIFSVGGFPGGQLSKGPFESYTWAGVKELLELNLEIPMRLSLRIVPELLRAGTPASLIYLSSQAGFHGRAGLLPYSTAKFGLNGFAKSLFAELRESLVKVCLVAPGYVDTDLIPESPQLDKSKMIEAHDVATAVSWALSVSKRCCPIELHLLTQQQP